MQQKNDSQFIPLPLHVAGPYWSPVLFPFEGCWDTLRIMVWPGRAWRLFVALAGACFLAYVQDPGLEHISYRNPATPAVLSLYPPGLTSHQLKIRQTPRGRLQPRRQPLSSFVLQVVSGAPMEPLPKDFQPKCQKSSVTRCCLLLAHLANFWRGTFPPPPSN